MPSKRLNALIIEMEMKIIKKKAALIRNIVLSIMLMFGIASVFDVGRCGNIDSAEIFLNNSQTSEQTNALKVENELMLNKAEVSQYSVAESKPIETTASQIPITNVAAKSSGKYSNETFTVNDLNSGNKVTMNGFDLVCQIVRNEVGAHYKSGANAGQTVFHKEAIKAYAVAAYTYLKYSVARGNVPSVGLNSDVSQALKSYVAEVDGQAIFYNNAYICAVYCASTGGSTLSSKYCWGTNTPYLTGVESKHDSQSKQYSSTKVLSQAEVKTIIEGNTNIRLSDKPENWFNIASVVDGNYVESLIIDGNSTCQIGDSEYKINGSVFREKILGFSNIQSPAFTIQFKDGNFYFTSYGFGHGVGLPAEGAELYATIDKWNYKQILEHYYTGVVIK